MTKLIKKSPKHEVIFKKIKNDLSVDSPGVRLLCPTCWTVRAAALSSIAENYVTLRILGMRQKIKAGTVKCGHK